MEEDNNVIYSYVQAADDSGIGSGEVVMSTDSGENIQVISGNTNNQVLTDESGQIVLCAENEGQEVFIYDDESGQYQKYVYVPSDQNEEELQDGHLMQQNQIISDQNETSSEIEQTEIIEHEEKEDDEGETPTTLLVTDESNVNVIKEDKSAITKNFTLNADKIAELQPGTIIQCNKCWETFLATEFEDHFNTHHGPGAGSIDQVVIAHDPGLKKCAICHLPSRSKKEYLSHYKQRHSGYKLGCPKCPQTYHSPELLHAHYTHFHLRGTPLVQGTSTTNKRAHVLLRCEYCDDIVEDLESHLMSVHELDEQTALAVTQDRPVQVVLESPTHLIYSSSFGGATHRPQPGPRKKPPQPMVALHCNICTKDFATQREFTNHRRRKDFCKPLYQVQQPIREEPKKIRRIGIIRKLIKS